MIDMAKEFVEGKKDKIISAELITEFIDFLESLLGGY